MKEPLSHINNFEIQPVDLNMNVHTLPSVEGLSISRPNLEPFWKLELIGIMDSPKTCDDDQALESFQKNIKIYTRTTGTLSLGHGRIYYLTTISLLAADSSLCLVDYRRSSIVSINCNNNTGAVTTQHH